MGVLHMVGVEENGDRAVILRKNLHISAKCPTGQAPWEPWIGLKSPGVNPVDFKVFLRKTLDAPAGAGANSACYIWSVSKRMVTGPSFWEKTCISAPNSPCSTWKPRARQASIKPS